MNIKLNISPVVLLRIPAFSLTDELPEVWEELKEAIAHSSSSFYNRIQSFKAEDISHLEPKMQFSIWKYFNRSKYRGTPFGQFAGFAVASLSSGNAELVFSKKQYFHRFKDWSSYERPKLSHANLTALDRIYLSNSSLYRMADHIRFISLENKAFELSSIAYSTFIYDLLVFCTEKVRYTKLLQFAKEKSITEEVLQGILEVMLDFQLLFTDLNANLIGPDYFERSNQLHQESTGDYLIAERKLISGHLSDAPLRHLSSCINSLLKLGHYKENKGIKDFATHFNQRFEGSMMPLMHILDPDSGIAYGEFIASSGNAGLAEELSGYTPEKSLSATHWTDFNSSLLRAMLKGAGVKNQVLQLKDLMTTANEVATLKPANSFSVLARFAGDLVVLDSVGGCTANALAGRFSLANESFGEHCIATASGESAANPEVIFFDVAYMAEGRVDNINRRKQIYAYELPILNYSCTENLIGLNDILVTVQGEEVILFSKKYGKRMIPRLASAYNYSRSDLPVYRFLCDLQHQGIQSQLLFNVQELLPGLDYYPRIQYENIVLSPARWRLRAKDLKGVALSVVLENMGLSTYFSIGEGDQTLCFNKSKTSDVAFLKQYVNQYDDFVLTEVICADCQVFNDELMNKYFTQVLLSVSHHEEIYSGYTPSVSSPSQGLESVIMPGKDWLYYEIYCHPDTTNFLLSERIAEFINAHDAAFKTWFFIRYNDPSPHLRLRIQLKDQQSGYVYMSRLMELLAADLQEGLIKDVKLNTYHREIARYGALQMPLTEQHFKKDSNYALEVIGQELNDFAIYRNCIELMKAALKLLSLEGKKLLGFVLGIQRAFEKEHQLKSNDFKMVNREWADFRVQAQLPEEELPSSLKELQQSFLDTLWATEETQRQSLFRSLFHMHINRLFSQYQRAHELLIYSFLHKQLQMEQQKLLQE
ncbi:thiopeptide-type bacteriocin biosynthesis protein [Pedobacter gandavensis]|uniref:lantibiotic dehydratase n=1 Tax=Pedobacter gandavensis TaxID=2679963 RepID=UPI0029315B09|nr:thiopeptide-type bacteriocin biosynthesis protein [Pedobacter gandavensis]